MNGIDKIIARMEADTQAECADIAAQAAAEAEAILARYRAEADKLLREGEARCKVLEHEQVERLEGGSRLACRQRVLAEKQRMLDEAFARAADALLKLPRPEYIDLLASLAAENGQGGEEGQPLGQGEIQHAAAEQAGLAQHQEQRHKAVQALGAGQYLQDQALGGLIGVLAGQSGGGLTHHTGALGGADAAQAGGQRRAQDGETQSAHRFKKS